MTNAKLPSPTRARKDANLTMRALAAKVPCALSTIYSVEASGRYPARIHLRTAYLAALGLTEAAR